MDGEGASLTVIEERDCGCDSICALTLACSHPLHRRRLARDRQQCRGTGTQSCRSWKEKLPVCRIRLWRRTRRLHVHPDRLSQAQRTRSGTLPAHRPGANRRSSHLPDTGSAALEPGSLTPGPLFSGRLRHTHQVPTKKQVDTSWHTPLLSIGTGSTLTNLWNHEVSFGKVDQWLGPAQGASFAYSNNAENIYAFEINRVEPLRIPLLSKVTGPFRYEFLVDELRGHLFIPNPAYEANSSPNVPNVINPGNPWVHIEKLSFRPTANLEFGFERTVIWGGKGHEPITLHSFLRSFFSLAAPGGQGSTGPNAKLGPDDPGARFGSFDFSYRLPFARNWLTLYADGEVHDDISPIDAPRRAAWRPGLYLSHIPGIPRLDMRAEAAWTDPPITSSNGGHFMYWESIQKQGYTNNGQLFGDWIGREDKGGQAWITYHLSGNEWIQLSARNQHAARCFIADSTTQYGTTLNDLSLQAVKRIDRDFEISGIFTFERFKAPIYLPGPQAVTTTNIQLTWYPSRRSNF